MSITVLYSTDKSALNTEIKNIIGHMEKNTIMIVPEQFSLSAEQNFSNVSKTDFEVISFKRLTKKIFESAGKITGGYVSTASKIMIMQRVIDTNAKKLSVYGTCADKPGFASAIAQTVSEFKHASLTPEIIEQKAKETESSYTGEKLADFSLLFNEFNRIVNTLGCDSDDDLTFALELLYQNPAFYGIADSCIIINNFNGFTMQEKRLIRLFCGVAEVYISVISDTMDDSASVCFASTVENIRKLTAGIQYSLRHIKGKHEMAAPQFLADNYFKYPCGTSQSRAVKITSATDAYSEVCSVACEIMRLCREEGYRFRDIGVVYRNSDAYCSVFTRVFGMFGIPMFLDYREPVSENPLISFIYAIGDIFEYNFSYDSVANLIKSVFSPVPREKADIFENFVLEYGISGRFFTDDECWGQRCSRAFRSDKYPAEDIEFVRNCVLIPLRKFREKTKGANSFHTHAKAFFELLCDYDVYGALTKISEEMNIRGDLRSSQVYVRIWNVFIGTLDEIVLVLGDTTGSFLKFLSVLRAGLDDATAGVIPPVADCVTVSDGQRFVGGDIKAVFAVGVNNGEFPPSASVKGVFDGADRDVFEAMGIELTANRITAAYAEQQILYKIFSAPSDRLYLSYRSMNSDGNSAAPSEVISRVKTIFTDITEEKDFYCISSPRYTFEKIIASKNYDNPDYGNVFTWFCKNDEWKEKIKLIEYDKPSNTVRLSDESLNRLYKDGFFGSISRLERFGSCAFSYFVTYNLRAKQRKIYKISNPDIGTLIHSVLEYSAVKIDKTVGWDDITLDMCIRITDEAVQSTAPEFLSGLLLSSPRYRYTLSKLTKLMSKNLYYIARQFSHSRFRPEGYEIEFGSGTDAGAIELVSSQGKRVLLTGKIDRCDVCKRVDGEYLRIIDYKSGNKELKLSDVYNGLNLQLLTYLDAVCGSDRKPAGVLYFKVSDAYERMDHIMDEKLLKAYMKGNYKMSGLLLSNGEVLLDMDDEFSSINVKEQKNGYKGDLATEGELEILRKGVKQSIRKLSSQILGGVIDINPANGSKNGPCKYCEFKNICRSTDGCRRLVKFADDSEVYAKMKEEQGDE